MSDRPRDIPTYLGGTPEQLRDEGNRPRSAASYCARYRIPIEDVEHELEQNKSHDEMVRFCNAWWATADEDFKRNARALVPRPMETRQQRRDKERKDTKRIEQKEKQLHKELRQAGKKIPAPAPASIDTFSRPGGFITDWKPADVQRYRQMWQLHEWSDEDLDGMVELLCKMTDGEWLKDHPTHTQRVYALSCIHLRDSDPAKYERLIVRGEMWENYG